jgi:hypothetical protein
MIDDAISELEPLVGTREACRATDRPQATHYRRHRTSPAPVRPPRERTPQPRALSPAERGYEAVEADQQVNPLTSLTELMGHLVRHDRAEGPAARARSAPCAHGTHQVALSVVGPAE